TLYALPASQRQLMTLILRKLLASSTYAISDTLAGLARKLEMAVAQAEAVDTPPEELVDNWEALAELADEWDGLDHGVGHPLLLLYDVKAPNGQKSKEFKGLGHYLFNTFLSTF